ncbi:zeta toxin family protein [Dyadobacter fanqingshengii]|uniref:Zeta toxin family protein n=1 Tax=Dyadobacter fanqingshengii TaxID=2906443 RepID=A0A9X1PAP6_9BACT|nr:zeta toxin family protein [Dyadobacter fanqingshengii]MCF0039960.1 zeta toxin family protein [Dyadobacter fanqingshengii]USJ38284.1 zeta toxin family protein [Dyadobacter fanqingshengii]
MPDLFLITGPNGAGKSLNANALIPKPTDFPVFDGDKIFYQLLNRHYKLTKVAKYARQLAEEELQRIFEYEISRAIVERQDYAYEGHFSTENSWKTIRRFQDAGYRINMIFLALENVNISLQRVAVRVSQGGHHVAPAHIYENFFGNIRLLDQNLPLIDRLTIIDNSSITATHILTLEDQKICFIRKDKVPAWIVNNMPELVKIIEQAETF